MKAAAFDYVGAKSVDEALKLLAAYGDRAKVLSGGQSLMPAMNLGDKDLDDLVAYLATLR